MKIADVLLPVVIPQLPGCDELLMKSELLKSARTFAKETESLIELQSETVTGKMTEIELDPDIDGTLLRVYSVIDDGETVNPVDYDVDPVAMKITFKRERGADGKVRPVKLCYAMMPKIATDDLPEDWLNRYGDGIAALTLFSLMNHPNKPYSNPQVAQLQNVLWSRERARAICEVSGKLKNTIQRLDLSGGKDF